MKKKSLKGMTLAEVIISMAVFAMLGVILIKLGMVVDTTTKSSNRLNKRVAVQAPYAASRETQYDVLDANGKPVLDSENNRVTAELNPDITHIDIFIDENVWKDAEGNEHKGDGTPDVVKVKKKDGTQIDYNSLTTIHGKHYSTADIVENNSEVYKANEVSNAKHHLQFIDVVERIDLDFTMGPNSTEQIYIGEGADKKELENAEWTYSSDEDKNIATIDANGKITSYGSDGTCIALGESDNGNFYVTITVQPI